MIMNPETVEQLRTLTEHIFNILGRNGLSVSNDVDFNTAVGAFDVPVKDRDFVAVHNSFARLADNHPDIKRDMALFRECLIRQVMRILRRHVHPHKEEMRSLEEAFPWCICDKTPDCIAIIRFKHWWDVVCRILGIGNGDFPIALPPHPLLRLDEYDFVRTVYHSILREPMLDIREALSDGIAVLNRLGDEGRIDKPEDTPRIVAGGRILEFMPFINESRTRGELTHRWNAFFRIVQTQLRRAKSIIDTRTGEIAFDNQMVTTQARRDELKAFWKVVWETDKCV